MFNNCIKLSKIDISNLNIENLLEASYMFSGCMNLEYVDISKFKEKGVEIANILYGCILIDNR